MLRGSGIELESLISRPTEPAPLIVVLHGWGASASRMTGIGELARADGFAVALVSMRGWGGSGGREDAGLRQPDDIVNAVGVLASEAWS